LRTDSAEISHENEHKQELGQIEGYYQDKEMKFEDC
jgi:hypothetical protein